MWKESASLRQHLPHLKTHFSPQCEVLCPSQGIPSSIQEVWITIPLCLAQPLVSLQTRLTHTGCNRDATPKLVLPPEALGCLKINWAVRTKQGIQETLLIPSSISLTPRAPRWPRVNEGLESVNEIDYTTPWMRQIVHLWRKGIIFCCA